MTKVAAWNKPNARRFAEEFSRDLAVLGEKYGLTFKVEGQRFTDADNTIKLRALVDGGSSMEQDDLKRQAALWNFDLDKVSIDGYKLVGYYRKKHTRPWVVEVVAANRRGYTIGKCYVMSHDEATLRFKK